MNQFAPSFIRSCISGTLTKKSFKGFAINEAQAESIKNALLEDAKGAIYSGIISLGDALAGIERSCFSWAAIKLYYSCFYFAKAELARRGLCVFYVGASPMYIVAIPGSTAVSQSGNSHTVVTKLYKNRLPNGVLCAQPIDSVEAFDWITNIRERVNYRDRRFSEPDTPSWFQFIADNGVRRSVSSYLDDIGLYAYDADHAVLALPLAALVQLSKSQMGFSGIGLRREDVRYVRSHLCDRRGPLDVFSFLDT